MFSYRRVVLSLAMLSSACLGMQVMRDGREFRVIDENGTHQVENCFKSKFLRGLNEEQLAKFEAAGNRIKAIQTSNGDYRVQEEGGLKGGFVLFAALATAATLTVGGIATVGTFIGTTAITLNPVVGFGAAAIVGHATVVAATYVAIVTTAAPTP